MYSTFEIRFMVAPSKVNREGLAPLQVSLIVNGERTHIQLPRKIKPCEFDTKRQRCKDSDTNEYINIVKARLVQIQTQLTAIGQPPTARKIKSIYRGEAIAKTWGILELFDRHNCEFEKLVGKTIVVDTYERYLLTRCYLTGFIKKTKNINDIPVKDITQNFVKSFFNYLLAEKNLSHNTAVGNMKRFKKIVVMAINDGSINGNPFGNLRFTIKKQDPLFLTEGELQIIINKPLTERLAKVRDVFVFSCYTGLAYIDVCELRRQHILADGNGNLWIRKPRQKTKVVSTIPLLPMALSILEKYCYNLPVSSNQKMNAYLKEIGTVCGLDKELHYHCSRHTAATLLLNRGASIEVVSKVLGHTNTKQTQHYARMLDKTVYNEVLKAMER